MRTVRMVVEVAGLKIVKRRITELQQRIAEAEEIIRAQKRLAWAMYNWPTDAHRPTDARRLSRDYEDRYGVDFDKGVYD